MEYTYFILVWLWDCCRATIEGGVGGRRGGGGGGGGTVTREEIEGLEITQVLYKGSKDNERDDQDSCARDSFQEVKNNHGGAQMLMQKGKASFCTCLMSFSPDGED